MKRVVYIAGPMRGYPEHNIPLFRNTARTLRRLGIHCVSPVEVGEMWAGKETDQSQHPPEAWVTADLRVLLNCNAIALLPGWEASVGARCEVAVAMTLGFAFVDPLTGEPVPRPARVVISGGYDQPPGRVELLDDLLEEVRAWQRETFPHATPASVAKHLLKEAKELEKRPDDDHEVADIQMLIAGARPAAVLVAAVRNKLEVCKNRTWGTPDTDGVVEHVRDTAVEPV